MNASVRVETVMIPTYGTGKPDKNPMFLEKRVYQGSSGKVYPLPIVDRILDEKEDKPYTAVWLENDYIEDISEQIYHQIFEEADESGALAS